MTTLRTLVVTTGIFLAISAFGQVDAAPIQWTSGSGGNDHYYELILVTDPYNGNNNSWATASASASASVFNGLQGHLAVVTSQAENDFLQSLIPGGLSEGEGAWLGGKSPEGWLVGPESGEAFGYTNFGGGEPNNAGIVYMIIGTPFAGVNTGQWADDSGIQGLPDPSGDRVIGYFVEYEAIIPEPTSWLLFASGLVCLVSCRRKTKI